MTDPNAPLSHEQALELLSADLDGEFDAAARELGFTPEVARLRLAETPDMDSLRGALAGSRARVAVPALDPDVRERLVARALEDGPRDELTVRRRLRFDARVLASAAAVALVAVGVVGALSIDRSGDDDAVAGSSADSAEESAPFAAGDDGAGAGDDGAGNDERAASAPAEDGALAQFSVGDVTDEAALRQSARELYDGRVETATGEPDGGDTDAGSSEVAPLVDDRCVAARARGLGESATFVARAVATYAGQPVEVLVFEEAAALEVLVIGSDCAELHRVTLPPQP